MKKFVLLPANSYLSDTGRLIDIIQDQMKAIINKPVQAGSEEEKLREYLTMLNRYFKIKDFEGAPRVQLQPPSLPPPSNTLAPLLAPATGHFVAAPAAPSPIATPLGSPTLLSTGSPDQTLLSPNPIPFFLHGASLPQAQNSVLRTPQPLPALLPRHRISTKSASDIPKQLELEESARGSFLTSTPIRQPVRHGSERDVRQVFSTPSLMWSDGATGYTPRISSENKEHLDPTYRPTTSSMQNLSEAVSLPFSDAELRTNERHVKRRLNVNRPYPSSKGRRRALSPPDIQKWKD